MVDHRNDGQKEVFVTQVVVSPKYQVVIPKEIRKKYTIHKGQKMVVLVKGDLIVLMRAIPLKHYRGFLKGMVTKDIRDKADRI